MTTRPIADLDPVEDPAAAFDPASPAARAVLAHALARGDRDEQPPPRRSRRRVRALATGLAVAAATGGVVLAGSGGSPALRPEEALAQAASRTAGFDSGRVVWSGFSTGTDGYRVESVNDVRFDGDRVLITSRTDEELPGGSQRLAQGDYLQIGRRQWLRAPGGEWREQPPVQRGGGIGITRRVQEEVGDERLLALVRAARDVRETGDGAYRGTIGEEELRTLGSPTEPGAGLATAFPPLGPGDSADVSVRVDGEGRIRALTIRTERFERSVSYPDLGTPQAIREP